MKVPFLIAILLVGTLSLGVGTVASFLSAYVFHPPDPKFGRYGSLLLGVYLSAWLSVCFMVSFATTIPGYRRLFGPRSIRHLVLYSAAFVGVLYASFWLGPSVLLFTLFNKLIGVFTRNELVRMIPASLAAFLITAWLFCRIAFVADRLFRRRTVAD